MQAIMWDWRKTRGFQRCCYGFLYVGFKIICLWPKKLSPIWHEDSCCCNMRREDFEWGSGQDFSTFWESLVLVKNPKAGYLSCSIFSEGVRCAQQQYESECLHLGLARVASCWLRDLLLFLMASEGTRGEGRALELVPFSVWNENCSGYMQLAPTKYFLDRWNWLDFGLPFPGAFHPIASCSVKIIKTNKPPSAPTG